MRHDFGLESGSGSDVRVNCVITILIRSIGKQLFCPAMENSIQIYSNCENGVICPWAVGR